MAIFSHDMVGSSGVDTGDIANSLRFRSSASAYLSRTFGTPTTQNTKTLSLWVKRGTLGVANNLWAANSGTNILYFNTDDTLRLVIAGAAVISTTAVFRDPTAHLHIVLKHSGTAITLYVNNVVVGTATATDSVFNTAILHYIAPPSSVGGGYLDGYLSRVCFVDGQALTPDSFGYLNTEINEWVSKSRSACKAVVDAGGANSFMLDFEDATSLTTLGYDKSSKGNNWTCNNISLTAGVTYDHMLDVPGNSFATLNPIAPNATYVIGTLQAGNLEKVAGASNNEVQGTLGVTSGKWYFEFSFATNATRVGIATGGPGKSAIGTKGVLYEASTGNKLIDGGSTAYGATFTQANVIGVALDADTNSVTFYKDNTSQGAISFTPTDVISPSIFTPNGVTITAYFNAGQRPFTYTPPTGFKALCQANLPDPAILNPKKHFDVLLYSGDSGASHAITGLQFTPDLVWDKCRNVAVSHALFNSVVGATKYLSSNSTAAETTDATSLASFNSDGFTLGSGVFLNNAGRTYVADCWKANGAAVTNTSGTITSQVSANVDSGFSIVTYTGTAGNDNIGHGLGVAPSLIIVKDRTGTQGWNVWHKAFSATQAIELHSTGAVRTTTTIWNSVLPNSAVFYVGNNAASNASGVNFVAYCFAEIPGYSKIGSYTGNGSADGPFVECGFKPRWVILKAASGGTGDWPIIDAARGAYNVATPELYASLPQADTSSNMLDLTASGFKHRSTNANANASGVTYIFYAIADVPAKYSNAR